MDVFHCVGKAAKNRANRIVRTDENLGDHQIQPPDFREESEAQKEKGTGPRSPYPMTWGGGGEAGPALSSPDVQLQGFSLH